MHSFVVPNSGWIAILVAVAEFSIGVALTLGLFTRIAALGSLVLLFTYVMSGTASVCAFYALFAIVILATWRTSRWIGVDGLISGYRQRHEGTSSTPVRSLAVTRAPEEVSSAKKSVAGVTLTTPVASIDEDATPTKVASVRVS
jgi:hypothetical protein